MRDPEVPRWAPHPPTVWLTAGLRFSPLPQLETLGIHPSPVSSNSPNHLRRRILLQMEKLRHSNRPGN